MADTEINKAAAARKENNLLKGTPGGIDTETGKKSVPAISKHAPALETFANDQAFTNQAPVKPMLTLGFTTAQEYVAYMTAEKKE